MTNDPTITLIGTSVPNTVVTVTRFGVGVIGSTGADPSGNWAFDYSGTALPNGDTLFTASATDAGNQTGPTATPFRVTVDLIPPAAPTIVDVADDGSLEFTGTAEPGSVMVEVTLVGTGVIGGSTVDAAGNWALTYAGTPLAAGSHSFTATATDLAGNTGPGSAAFTIDTTLAAPIITSITDDTGSSSTDGTTSDNTLILNGTATDGDTITVKLLGGAVLGTTTAGKGGEWNFDHSSAVLTDGAYTFSAAASNKVGTSASSPAFAVRVDTNAPSVVSVNRQNPTVAVSSAASITFRMTLSESTIGVDVADVTPVFSGGLSGSISDLVPIGTNSFDVTLALSGEGTVRLDVNAGGTGIADVAGNPLSGGFTTGQPYTRSLTGNGIWIQNGSGGLWASNGNWLNGIIGAGVGSTADFTTLELVDDLVVNLDSPRTVGNVVFGDTDINSPGNWIVDNGGSATNTLNLAVGAGTPSIVVNPLGLNAAATMSVPLVGNQGLTKLGTGTLLLTRSNTLTGPLNVSAGILRIATGGSSLAGVVNISTGGAILNIAGGSFSATGNLTVNAGAGSALIVDSGAASFTGLATNNTQGGLLRVNGGTVTATSVNLPRSSDANPSFANGFVVTGGNTTINGPIGIGTNNSWGSMSVEGGSLAVTGIVTLANQASAARGGQMRVINGTFTSTNAATGILMCRNNGTNTN
ncbi:MAG: Ig-like domain-containing protein, partial [Pyrinomonadaceae bacterium]|nr:Ig-like domain-containing protein [Pyrinomonadaceae bacterium]